jgi:hypothetical protein
VCLYSLNPTTGVASLVGTTGLFETPLFGLASCGSLASIALLEEDEEGITGVWVSESATTGLATVGPDVETFPIGYDCDSTTGGPLWALTSPEAEGPLSPLATEVSVAQVDPETGATTVVVPVADPTADLMALAVVPDAAPTPPTTPTTPTTAPAAAAAAVVAPTFTG